MRLLTSNQKRLTHPLVGFFIGDLTQLAKPDICQIS